MAGVMRIEGVIGFQQSATGLVAYPLASSLIVSRLIIRIRLKQPTTSRSVWRETHGKV